ncbi:MAG TPA: OmpA family protein [Saprospiraceae bacterium]|nr:OmpA family protein [Saprospiraceae bacterium]
MKHIIFIIFYSGFSFSLFGQQLPYNHVIRHIENRQYTEALHALNEFSVRDRDYYFLRGVTSFYLGNLNQAIENLTQSYRLGSKRPEIMKYIAQSHLKNEEFHEASRAFKLYLNELKFNDPERQEIINSIKRCAYGLKAKHMEKQGFIENMGDPVNSTYDEISPFFHPKDGNKLLYSSNRPVTSKDSVERLVFPEFNILIWDLLQGKYYTSQKISPLVNTRENEIIQSFTGDMDKILFLRNTGSNHSQIYREELFSAADYVSKPFLLSEFIHPDKGDRDLFVVNDSLILFSSEREGGFGGYDIYLIYKEKGIWKVPKNLGPDINSPFDERSPFLTKSGTTLFFSSNRLESIGGFDIFTSTFGLESGKWMPVENLGYPISSPGDDLFFRLFSDGRSAVYSSDRKESIGGFDLFIAYFKNTVLEQLSYGEVPFIHDVQDESREISVFTQEEEIIVREFAVEPLSFGNDNEVLTTKNKQILDLVIDHMKLYPTLEVTLAGHTVNEGNKAYDLFFSIKKAENASDYLISKGVDTRRIHLLGLGSAYPMVKNANSILANRHDKRIELYFNDLKNKGLTIINNIPFIADNFRDKSYDDYLNIRTGVTFGVEMIHVRQIFDHPIIRYNDHVMVSKVAGSDHYAYFLGMIPTYEEAIHVQSKLREEGFDESLILVFLDGLLINKSQVLENYEKYPQLKNYIFGEILKE